MSSMKSDATAKDSEEEATGAGAAGDGASASADNVTVVNVPTVPSEVVEGEGSAGTNNNNNDNEREQSSSSLHRNQVQHQHQQEQQGQDEEATDSVTSSSATARTRPDAFQIYSDDDTRMLGLLGQDASANPNDAGEQQVNWRQLVGLSAAEQERRRRDVNAENGDTTRRTRLSYELHPAVFAEMWFGPGGEFDLNDGAARNDVLAERRGEGGRQEQDQDDGEDLDDGGV